MRTNDILLGLLGLAALGYVAYNEERTSKIVKRVGMAADRVRNAPDWELEKGFLEKAVSEAADNQIRQSYSVIQSKVESEFANLARAKVREAVNSCSDKLAASVSDEIARQSMEIDKDFLLKKAVEKAQNKALEKFDRKLDDVLDNLTDKFEDDRYERRRRVVVI